MKKILSLFLSFSILLGTAFLTYNNQYNILNAPLQVSADSSYVVYGTVSLTKNVDIYAWGDNNNKIFKLEKGVQYQAIKKRNNTVLIGNGSKTGWVNINQTGISADIAYVSVSHGDVTINQTTTYYSSWMKNRSKKGNLKPGIYTFSICTDNDWIYVDNIGWIKNAHDFNIMSPFYWFRIPIYYFHDGLHTPEKSLDELFLQPSDIIVNQPVKYYSSYKKGKTELGTLKKGVYVSAIEYTNGWVLIDNYGWIKLGRNAYDVSWNWKVPDIYLYPSFGSIIDSSYSFKLVF